MTTKKTNPLATAPAATPAKADPNGYNVNGREWGLTEESSTSQAIAALSTRSAMTATTYKAFANCGDKLEVSDLVVEMRKAGDEVGAGNMGRIERMLTNQAMTLDAIFNNMAQRSHRQDSFKGIEVLMRLALKAQAQARSTAEALALLKNPQPYIRQANIANGPQQVNNGSPVRPINQYAQAHAGGGDIQSEQHKLLEAVHGQRMDIGTPGQASQGNTNMATVESIHRA